MARRALTLFSEEEARDREAGDADWNVDEEDPAPRLELDEITAEHRAGRGRDGRRDREHGRRRRAFRWREGAIEHRRAHGRQHAAANTLQDAEADERLDVPGERAEERARRQDR